MSIILFALLVKIDNFFKLGKKIEFVCQITSTI